MAIRTNAEKLEPMRHVAEASFRQFNRFILDRTVWQRIHALAEATDNMVMVVILAAQLVANRTIAKIAAVN